VKEDGGDLEQLSSGSVEPLLRRLAIVSGRMEPRGEQRDGGRHAVRPSEERRAAMVAASPRFSTTW
jgi:hypothetical protein